MALAISVFQPVPRGPSLPSEMKAELLRVNIPPLTGDSRDGFPARAVVEIAIQMYLDELSPKKRGKALIDRVLYDRVFDIALRPNDYTLGDAQFRWWVRKGFTLATDFDEQGTYLVHESRPVVVREQIYDVLVQAHAACDHGGRDKTSAELRSRYSYVPKELVSRFVSLCPGCDAHERRDTKYFAYKLNRYYPVNSQIRELAIQVGHADLATYSQTHDYEPLAPPGMRVKPKKRVRRKGTKGAEEEDEDASNDGGKVMTFRERALALAAAAAPYPKPSTSTSRVGPVDFTQSRFGFGPPLVDASPVDIAQPAEIRMGRIAASSSSPAASSPARGTTSKASTSKSKSSLGPDYFSYLPATAAAAKAQTYEPEQPTPGYSFGSSRAVNPPAPITAVPCAQPQPQPQAYLAPTTAYARSPMEANLGLPTPYSSSFNGMPLPSPLPMSVPAHQVSFASPMDHQAVYYAPAQYASVAQQQQAVMYPSPVSAGLVQSQGQYGYVRHPSVVGAVAGVEDPDADAEGEDDEEEDLLEPEPEQEFQASQAPASDAESQPLAVPYQDAQGRVATNEKDFFDLLILGRKQELSSPSPPVESQAQKGERKGVRETAEALARERRRESPPTANGGGGTFFCSSLGLVMDVGPLTGAQQSSSSFDGSAFGDESTGATSHQASYFSYDGAANLGFTGTAPPAFDPSMSFDWLNFDIGPFPGVGVVGTTQPTTSMGMTSTPPSISVTGDGASPEEAGGRDCSGEVTPELSNASSGVTVSSQEASSGAAYFDWTFPDHLGQAGYSFPPQQTKAGQAGMGTELREGEIDGLLLDISRAVAAAPPMEAL